MTLLSRMLPARRRGGAGKLIIAALTVAGAGALAVIPSPANAAVPTAPAGMTLRFSDDFVGADGASPNTANWQFATGRGYPGGAPNWGTGEVETMTSSRTNSRLNNDGKLVITPVRDGAGNWTSARLETRRTDFAAPAGGKLKVEATIQQPNVTGAAAAGYWPAFWMLGAAARPVGATNWPRIGEIDIMEAINGRGSTFAALHCGVAPGGPCNEFTGLGSGERACAGCLTGYHKYSMVLDRSVNPERIDWFLDDRNIHTVRANQMDATTWNNATHHGFFIILNVAMGGGFPAAFGGGPTAATRSGASMLVGYVAVWST